MAHKKIITVTKDGVLKVLTVHKPQAPRSTRVWLGACAATAIGAQGRRYAVRMGGEWAVRGVSQSDIIKSFPNEDAAAMWLVAFPGHAP